LPLCREADGERTMTIAPLFLFFSFQAGDKPFE
jgi:hypothetical protein